MNKTTYFVLGTVFGAVAGSVTTYFATKRVFAQRAAEAIESYAEYADDKIQQKIDRLNELINEDAEEALSEEEPDDSTEESNEGVKVYQNQYAPQITLEELAERRKESGVKNEVIEATEDKKTVIVHNFPDGIEEVDEETYLADDEYDRTTLHYVFHEDKLYYGYETDNEELATDFYDVTSKDDIIGPVWRWSSDYTDGESGIGVTYIKNDNLETVFEVLFNVDVDRELEFDPEEME